jgi:hypothetical protein
MSTAISTSVTTADTKAYVYPDVTYPTPAAAQDDVLYSMLLTLNDQQP